ncbi:MAG: hypothetical protein ACLU3I_09465 [Acutalibacteraceae bacterium]
MEYPKVCLRRGEEGGVLKGQRLIYDNELDWADDICTDGCVVDVLDSRQRFAARGFFNSNSRLAVRVLTRDEAEPIDRAFFARRIEAAWHTRQALGFSDSCRVVFGESDGLPGLTVDKFADCLSFQIACLGLEQWKPELVSILAELSPRAAFTSATICPCAKKRASAHQDVRLRRSPRGACDPGARRAHARLHRKRPEEPGIFSTSRKTGAG